jgi:hypothetical protein
MRPGRLGLNAENHNADRAFESRPRPPACGQHRESEPGPRPATGLFFLALPPWASQCPGLINPCQVVVRLWWWFPCHHGLLIPLKSGRSPGTSGASSVRKPNSTKPNGDTAQKSNAMAITPKCWLSEDKSVSSPATDMIGATAIPLSSVPLLAPWCHPKLVVEVKHLAGSKLLRHATVKRLAT